MNTRRNRVETPLTKTIYVPGVGTFIVPHDVDVRWTSGTKHFIVGHGGDKHAFVCRDDMPRAMASYLRGLLRSR